MDLCQLYNKEVENVHELDIHERRQQAILENAQRTIRAWRVDGYEPWEYITTTTTDTVTYVYDSQDEPFTITIYGDPITAGYFGGGTGCTSDGTHTIYTHSTTGNTTT